MEVSDSDVVPISAPQKKCFAFIHESYKKALSILKSVSSRSQVLMQESFPLNVLLQSPSICETSNKFQFWLKRLCPMFAHRWPNFMINWPVIRSKTLHCFAVYLFEPSCGIIFNRLQNFVTKICLIFLWRFM